MVKKAPLLRWLGAVHFVHQRHHFVFRELLEALRNDRVLVRLELLRVGHVLGPHLSFGQEEDSPKKSHVIINTTVVEKGSTMNEGMHSARRRTENRY